MDRQRIHRIVRGTHRSAFKALADGVEFVGAYRGIRPFKEHLLQSLRAARDPRVKHELVHTLARLDEEEILWLCEHYRELIHVKRRSLRNHT